MDNKSQVLFHCLVTLKALADNSLSPMQTKMCLDRCGEIVTALGHDELHDVKAIPIVKNTIDMEITKLIQQDI